MPWQDHEWKRFKKIEREDKLDVAWCNEEKDELTVRRSGLVLDISKWKIENGQEDTEQERYKSYMSSTRQKLRGLSMLQQKIKSTGE